MRAQLTRLTRRIAVDHALRDRVTLLREDVAKNQLCSLVLGLRFGAGFESAPAIPAPEPALGSHSCVALYSGSGTFQFRPAILALNALNPRGSGTESPIQ
jgi:hypothetical protein